MRLIHLDQSHYFLRYDMQLLIDVNNYSDSFTNNQGIKVYQGEFWTAKQRQGHSLHEVSYRACFKPQLPGYFLTKYCNTDDVVYDPFMGRGTTLIEAQLHNCNVIGNDINPLSKVLVEGRLQPPSIIDVKNTLNEIDLEQLSADIEIDKRFLVFFHNKTLKEIYGWKTFFEKCPSTPINKWLQMVACSKLTGHGKSYFSGYTLPPNLAASFKSQKRINEKSNKEHPYKDTKEIILKKTGTLLKNSLPSYYTKKTNLLLNESADKTPQIESNTVDLVITSPPFLAEVNYLLDNWIKMWFCDIELGKDKIWQTSKTDIWSANMKNVFHELKRVLTSKGRIVFEVGEVKKKSIFLEDLVIPAAKEVGLNPEYILINTQAFTKTAHCWGIQNNKVGTNTNRIIVFQK